MAQHHTGGLGRWLGLAALAVGLVWLAANPDLLFETSPPTPTVQQPAQTQHQARERAQKSAKRLRRTKPAISEAENGFDFYVLALSWSPSYCAENGRRSGIQCGGKRYYSFIVHGLWPQYEKGWPANCDARAPKVENRLADSMLDIMPAHNLIQHEWRKHGTCSGLGQDGYFTKLRAAYERIRFPARYRLNDGYLTVSPGEVERAFMRENTGLSKDAIAVTCGNRWLREVRICFSKDLNFRPCREIDRKACRKNKIVMPPVRGTG